MWEEPSHRVDVRMKALYILCTDVSDSGAGKPNASAASLMHDPAPPSTVT